MKRVLKIFGLLFLMCLFLTGCGNNYLLEDVPVEIKGYNKDAYVVEGYEKTVDVTISGEQSDIDCSIQLVDFLGIKNYTVDIGVAFDALINNIHLRTDIDEFTNQTLTNLPPRIRMSTLYAISQSLNGRVINTNLFFPFSFIL